MIAVAYADAGASGAGGRGELEEAEAMAARFDVSQLAIGWRLFNLGLV